MFDDEDEGSDVRAGAMFKKQVLAQVTSNREKLNGIEAKLDAVIQTLKQLTSKYDESRT